MRVSILDSYELKYLFRNVIRWIHTSMIVSFDTIIKPNWPERLDNARLTCEPLGESGPSDGYVSPFK
jgi:hypothetical protein